MLVTTNDKIEPIYKFCGFSYYDLSNTLESCINVLYERKLITLNNKNNLTTLYSNISKDKTSIILLVNLMYEIVIKNNKNNH